MTVMILSVVLADLIIVAPKSVNFGIRLLTFSILSAIHLISILDLIALRCWSCYDLVWVYVNIKFVFLHTYVGIWVSSSNCEGYFCRANVLLTLEYFIRSIPQGAYLSPLNCRKTMTLICFIARVLTFCFDWKSNELESYGLYYYLKLFITDKTFAWLIMII